MGNFIFNEYVNVFKNGGEYIADNDTNLGVALIKSCPFNCTYKSLDSIKEYVAIDYNITIPEIYGVKSLDGVELAYNEIGVDANVLIKAFSAIFEGETWFSACGCVIFRNKDGSTVVEDEYPEGETELIAYYDFGEQVVTEGTPFKIIWKGASEIDPESKGTVIVYTPELTDIYESMTNKGQVKTTSADEHLGYLFEKLAEGEGIGLTVENEKVVITNTKEDFIKSISSTDSVILSATSGDLSGYVRVSESSGNILSVSADGLYVPETEIPEDYITSATDTETINLSVNDGTLSGAVRISVSADNILIKKDDGLYVAKTVIPEDYITSSVDTNTISLDVDGGVLSGEVKVSVSANNILSKKNDGLYVPETIIPEDYITSANDTKTIDLSVVSGDLTGDVKISVSADNILTVNDDGLYAAKTIIPEDYITSSVETNTIALGVTNKVLSGNVKISETTGNILSVSADGLYVPETIVPEDYITSATDSHSVLLFVDDKTLSAMVNISESSGNILDIKDDGLYVPETIVPEDYITSTLDTSTVSLSVSSGELRGSVRISETSGNMIEDDNGLYVPPVEIPEVPVKSILEGEGIQIDDDDNGNFTVNATTEVQSISSVSGINAVPDTSGTWNIGILLSEDEGNKAKFSENDDGLYVGTDMPDFTSTDEGKILTPNTSGELEWRLLTGIHAPNAEIEATSGTTLTLNGTGTTSAFAGQDMYATAGRNIYVNGGSQVSTTASFQIDRTAPYIKDTVSNYYALITGQDTGLKYSGGVLGIDGSILTINETNSITENTSGSIALKAGNRIDNTAVFFSADACASSSQGTKYYADPGHAQILSKSPSSSAEFNVGTAEISFNVRNTSGIDSGITVQNNKIVLDSSSGIEFDVGESGHGTVATITSGSFNVNGTHVDSSPCSMSVGSNMIMGNAENISFIANSIPNRPTANVYIGTPTGNLMLSAQSSTFRQTSAGNSLTGPNTEITSTSSISLTIGQNIDRFSITTSGTNLDAKNPIYIHTETSAPVEVRSGATSGSYSQLYMQGTNFSAQSYGDASNYGMLTLSPSHAYLGVDPVAGNHSGMDIGVTSVSLSAYATSAYYSTMMMTPGNIMTVMMNGQISQKSLADNAQGGWETTPSRFKIFTSADNIVSEMTMTPTSYSVGLTSGSATIRAEELNLVASSTNGNTPFVNVVASSGDITFVSSNMMINASTRLTSATSAAIVDVEDQDHGSDNLNGILATSYAGGQMFRFGVKKDTIRTSATADNETIPTEKAVREAIDSASGGGTEWYCGSFTTANRPSNPTEGQYGYDTTIDCVIYYIDGEWKNSAGAIV